MSVKKRYKLISCEIMFREVCLCVSKSPNIIDVTFMPKGLHDIGDKKMSEKLQNEIDNVDSSKYDAILLCYGLCNNGICNLRSEIPIIVPRAHDCITLLMGSRHRYKEYFNTNPGTFFKSPGWIERDVNPNSTEGSVTSRLGMDKSHEEYVELYGEENAEYLASILGDWTSNYTRITFIDTGTGDINLDRQIAKENAESNNWKYEEVKGDLSLISRLLDGKWTEDDFLFVSPANRIKPSNDADIVLCSPVM